MYDGCNIPKHVQKTNTPREGFKVESKRHNRVEELEAIESPGEKIFSGECVVDISD